MPIDSKLLEILRCPVTKQQVYVMSKEQLTAINDEISSGNVLQADGSAVEKSIREGLITENKNRVYRIEKNIPIMLEDESILTNQLKGF
jgi:uncharacterized protein YbaR (Trm112 family)